MITYELEKLTDELIEEITPILEDHRVELQSYKDMALNPNWEKYRQIEAAGDFRFLIARDEDNTIVGYAAFVMFYNMHYNDYKMAIEDVFYVVQDKRGSRIAINLVKKSEAILKELGVHVITHHAKFTNTFAEFLEKLGYHKTETMLAKRIN